MAETVGFIRSTTLDVSSSSPISESVHDVIENVVEAKAYEEGKYTVQIKSQWLKFHNSFIQRMSQR